MEAVMISAEFRLLRDECVVDFLRGFEPQFANRICENHLRAAVPALIYERESELIQQASRISANINDTYVKPNFGKHQPILSCVVSEEDEKNQLVFNIPLTRTAFVSIKARQDRTVLVRWPEPRWKDLAVLLSRLMLGNGMRGTVVLDQFEPISFRAALVVSLLGPDLAGPMIDMAQDGLLEDYPCEESTLKPAYGLKKKSKGTFLEL
jgi:hypothetical protein